MCCLGDDAWLECKCGKFPDKCIDLVHLLHSVDLLLESEQLINKELSKSEE